MGSYAFRIRFIRSPRSTINIEAHSVPIEVPESTRNLTLAARARDEDIMDAGEWVLKSEGWPTEQDALEAGAQFQNALMVTLACLRVGADFGKRAPKGLVTNAGLKMMEDHSGRRVLNDEHGLMAYDSEPPPRFAKVGAGSVITGTHKEKFVATFTEALRNPPSLSDREKLSLELFFASFFQESEDTRFLLLVMAVEALVEPRDRPDETIDHVDRLIELTCNNESLSESESDSIVGALRWLRKQSIRQASRGLICSRLGLRLYKDQSASSYFLECYNVRSRMVHGEPPLPTRQEVGSLAATLEVLVSDLLAGDLLEIDL